LVFQEEIMSRSRAAFFSALVGAAAVVLAVSATATAGADTKPAPTTSTTAHTNGDEWIG
jgi:hypothetical protein